MTFDRETRKELVAELLKLNVKDAHPPEVYAGIAAQMSTVMAKGSVEIGETFLLAKDGRRIPVDGAGSRWSATHPGCTMAISCNLKWINSVKYLWAFVSAIDTKASSW